MSETAAETDTAATAQEQQTTSETTTSEATPTLEELQTKLDEVTKEARKWETRSKENHQAKTELEKQRQAAMTDAERAVAEAEAKGRTAAASEFGKRLATSEIRAQAADAQADLAGVFALSRPLPLRRRGRMTRREGHQGFRRRALPRRTRRAPVVRRRNSHSPACPTGHVGAHSQGRRPRVTQHQPGTAGPAAHPSDLGGHRAVQLPCVAFRRGSPGARRCLLGHADEPVGTVGSPRAGHPHPHVAEPDPVPRPRRRCRPPTSCPVTPA